MKYAFINAAGILKAWGFVETNEPSDIKISVPEDFALEPGEWQYIDGEWAPLKKSDS